MSAADLHSSTGKSTASHRELLQRFSLEDFRPGQEDVISAVLSGRDCLCVMPTGGGKSLCYQLPSLALPGTTIVVSPLIALMKDQVDRLSQHGIRAELINSSLSLGEQDRRMQQMAEGAFDLVYVAPERLRNDRFLQAVRRANVTLLAVDEAHCVSEWGHDFRPDYARLGLFRERFLGNVQAIALTATATPLVRDDIAALLQLRQPAIFVTGFARENLRFEVTACGGDRDKDERLLDFLQHQEGAGIIYAATRKRCEELADWLPERLRRRVGIYHAGLAPEQRRDVQDEFMSGRLDAIVATNAFGMGIDKADIRYVVHYNMPGSLEAYYQEAGRAGRDGKASRCVLLFSFSDRYVQEFFIENNYPSPEIVRAVFELLRRQTNDPIELTLQEIAQALPMKASSESIGTAETLLAKTGVLRRLSSSENQAILRIDSDLETLVDLLPREAKVRRKVLRACEKLVGVRRYEEVYVTQRQILEAADLEKDSVARALRELARLKAFDYVPPFRGRAVHFRDAHVEFDQLDIDFAELERRKAAEYAKLEEVIRYAQTSGCRQRRILQYFGDKNSEACGRCDRCTPLVESDQQSPQPQGSQVKPQDENALLRGVQIALSGIARTHGRFGKNLIAQMLAGSSNKKIQQWKLNRLSTYGLLAGLKQNQLVDLIDRLVGYGLVQQLEVEQHRPTMELSDLGRGVMNGAVPLPADFRLPRPLAQRLIRCANRIPDPGQRPAPVDDSDTAPGDAPQLHEESDALPASGGEERESARARVIEALRQWRRERSTELAMPAYRVLNNATIESIAERLPSDSSSLESIKGIGPATIEQFGHDIIQVVDAAAQRKETSCATETTGAHLATVPTAQRSAAPEAPAEKDGAESPQASGQAGPAELDSAQAIPEQPPTDLDEQAYWTWRLLTDGYTISQCEKIRRLKRKDVLRHLVMAAEARYEVPLQWGMEPADAKLLQRIMARSGADASPRLRSLLPPHLDPTWLEIARITAPGLASGAVADAARSRA